jgi:hypothetical protein
VKKIYYIFLVFLIIVVGVEFRVREEEISKKLRKIIDKIEKGKELIL